MAKRSNRTTPERHSWYRSYEDGAAVHRPLQQYLSQPVYEALRRIAFEERVKIHDVVLEGIDAVLRRRGYQSVEKLKGGKRR
jgi:hypothetical protein